MHHKRGKPKSSRAGCLFCKPNKLGKGMENKVQHKGFGAIKARKHADADLKLEQH